MIFVENLLKELKKNKVDYFSGVPDSVLKNFTNHLENNKNFKNPKFIKWRHYSRASLEGFSSVKFP